MHHPNDNGGVLPNPVKNDVFANHKTSQANFKFVSSTSKKWEYLEVFDATNDLTRDLLCGWFAMKFKELIDV